MAAPFDLERGELIGPAVPMVEDVAGVAASGAMAYTVSPTGSLVYLPGGGSFAAATLVWVDRDGREQALAAEPLDTTLTRC